MFHPLSGGGGHESFEGGQGGHESLTLPMGSKFRLRIVPFYVESYMYGLHYMNRPACKN